MGIAYLSSTSLLSVVCRAFGDETPSLQLTDRMRDVGHEYLVLLQGHMFIDSMHIPFYLSVTGRRLTDSRQLGPSYWQCNLESPVRFYSAAQAVL